jgi:hypothetical protein
MLESEFAYFLKNQDQWSNSHYDKYVVVIGNSVFGFFESMLEAYRAAKADHKVGTFLIQHCIPGPESYTQVFFSNVTLA